MPHELGQKKRFDILFSLSSSSNGFLIINYFHLKYVDLNEVDFKNLNLKKIQEELNISSKNGVELRIGVVLKDSYNIKLFTKLENERIEALSFILQIVLF